MIMQYYPLIIELEAPAIITGPSADPNSVLTETYIPGSSIRGAFATHISRESSDLLESFILSDEISYLNAYPVIDNARALPVPNSYREEKYDKNAVHDLASLNYSDWPDEQLKPIQYEYATYTSADRHGINIETSSQLHHQQDREAGRPLGEDEGRGTVFVYQYIERNQSFIGFVGIRGETKSDVDNRFEDLRNVMKKRILVGRSKRASYGGNAKLTWKEPIDREIKLTGMSGVVRDDIEQGEILCVILLSDAVIRNQKTGQVDSAYLAEELISAMDERIEIIREYTSARISGGYNRKWGLPVPQSQAAAAGSVVVLKAKQDIPLDDILALENRGIGERRIEGFGRLVFMTSTPSRVNIRQFEADKDVSKPSSIPPLIRDMERRIIESVLLRECDIAAHYLAKTSIERSSCSSNPSNSLIGRIRGVLRYEPENALSHLRDWFEGESETSLRKQARRQLQSCQVFIEGSSKNLLEWISELAKNNEKRSAFDIRSYLGIEAVIERKHITTRSDVMNIVDDLLPAMKVRLLHNYLWEMVKMRKSAKNGGA